MDHLQEYLKPVIDLLPEPLQDYWLAIFFAAALVVLLPLAWYQRRLLRALLLPRRPVQEQPQLDEDLANFVPPPGMLGPRRLFIEGVPGRLRLVVVAAPGKGATIPEAAIGEVLDQVRWGLAAIARQDQAAFRVWPGQLSAHGFPAVFHRQLHKAEPEGQPSHWVLLAGPTPPRPQSVLLGLAVWTEAATTIGLLSMDTGLWMKTLDIEAVENQERVADPAAPEPARAEGPGVADSSPPVAETEGAPSGQPASNE